MCRVWGAALFDTSHGNLTRVIMVTLVTTMPSYAPSVPSSSTPNSPRHVIVVALRVKATLNLPGLPSVSRFRAPPHPCGDFCAGRAPKLTREGADFRTILKQDPSSAEAKNALRETLALMLERDDDDDFAVPDDEGPLLSDTKVELESVSDSSDWNHEGNGIPCRFYNHDGCKRGNDCRFSHAPDHKSVRDRLCVSRETILVPS